MNIYDAFAADLKARKLSEQTVTNYMRVVRRFLRFAGNESADRIGDDTGRLRIGECAPLFD
jgi:integrase-like protein